MLLLDTHAVVWLFDGKLELFSPFGLELIRQNELFASPIVELEMTYLHEIGRCKLNGPEMLAELSNQIGLVLLDDSLTQLIKIAENESWTRDLFDRLIVSQAKLHHARLLTKDNHIQKHYGGCVW